MVEELMKIRHWNLNKYLVEFEKKTGRRLTIGIIVIHTPTQNIDKMKDAEFLQRCVSIIRRNAIQLISSSWDELLVSLLHGKHFIWPIKRFFKCYFHDAMRGVGE